MKLRKGWKAKNANELDEDETLKEIYPNRVAIVGFVCAIKGMCKERANFRFVRKAAFPPVPSITAVPNLERDEAHAHRSIPKPKYIPRLIRTAVCIRL